MGETGGEGGRLTEVAPEPDDHQRRIRGLQSRQAGEGFVQAAIVYDDDFVGPPHALEH